MSGVRIRWSRRARCWGRLAAGGGCAPRRRPGRELGSLWSLELAQVRHLTHLTVIAAWKRWPSRDQKCAGPTALGSVRRASCWRRVAPNARIVGQPQPPVRRQTWPAKGGMLALDPLLHLGAGGPPFLATDLAGRSGDRSRRSDRHPWYLTARIHGWPNNEPAATRGYSGFAAVGRRFRLR